MRIKKKSIILLAILIMVLTITLYFLGVYRKVTYGKLNNVLQNSVSMEEFKPDVQSGYFLAVPETQDKNSLLINFYDKNSFRTSKQYLNQNAKVIQSIDLGGFYDNIFQDKNDLHVTNIVDSNGKSKTLFFNCGQGKINYSDSTNVIEEIPKNIVKYEGEGVVLKADVTDGISEVIFTYILDFVPEFIVDGVKYNIVDYTGTYCHLLILYRRTLIGNPYNMK